MLQQNVTSMHMHNEVDFDKSKRIIYFQVFMPITKAFFIVVPAVHFYCAQEIKTIKYLKVSVY
jgi:hypothetical protein